ncbi:MAG TPA: GH25 family lysozyme, partial [Acetobacteraceae bacterium]|nr:GH25 family lysozyme [Acetobacteraceae bacterium]
NGIADRRTWLQRAKDIWLAVPAPAPSSRAEANINGAANAAAEVAPDELATVPPPSPMPAAIIPPPPAARPFDPTDASLYGQFVQAAYSMYSQNLSKPTALTPPPSSDFPQAYRLAAWIQMQDFILQSTAPTFYGFIAQSKVGPSQFIVAIRGTSNGVEWWDDANAVNKAPFKNLGCGSVGMGFARIYDTLEVVDCQPPMPGAALGQSLKVAGTFAQQISALVRRHTPAAAAPGGIPAGASVEITGHSLGAALATLYVMENAKTEQLANPALCTFASPLVGDATFAAAFNALGLTSWRVDNAPDLVTKIPPAILGFVHVDTKVPVNSAGKVMPLVTCWHSLATYLSLIDPTKQPDPGCRLWAAAEPPSPPLPAVPLSSSGPPPSGARTMNRIFAIDIDHANNVQDTPGPLGGFSQVKARGIAFLIHKATEGLTFADPRYAARRAAWMNGIPVPVIDVNDTPLQITPRFAAYHFFHGEDPVREAEFFLNTARLQPGDDAVVDWEPVPGSGFVPSADAVDAFCNVVESALGFSIIVYSGSAAKQQLQGSDPRFAKRRLWLAEYSSTWTTQQSWTYPWLWQNNGGQSGGANTIPGIDGNCDNSTVVYPRMTVEQLAADWGGGAQGMRRPTIIASARPGVQPPGVTARKIARYGWKPDLPDQRDYSYAVPAGVVQNTPSLVDLRQQCPAVYDQGQIGSCTANAIAAALEFDMMKQGLHSFTPSRLFIYYNERSMEGTVAFDAGAQIRDGIKSVASQGDCPESEWTYDGSPPLPNKAFPPGAKAAIAPLPQCYADAIQHKALTYQVVDQNLADMRGCLASGYPFVLGFTVYESFESAQVASTGIVTMPAAGESVVGGHAVLAVGYDDDRNMFIVRNSWGPGWGLGGYFYMPYAYLLDDNLSNDFWTIRVVGG